MKFNLKDLTQMLGVEFGEEFYIIDSLGDKEKCKITEGDIMFYCTCHEDWRVANGNIIRDIFKFSYEVEKKPFKPRDEDTYYFVSMGTKYTQEGAILSDIFYSKNTYDLALLYFGNCFRTRKEAEENKNKVIERYREVQKQLAE